MTRRIRYLNSTLVLALVAVGLGTQFWSTSKNTNQQEAFNRRLSTTSSSQSQIRLLSFGTSRAWGAGLKDRFQAYPYLLSNDVRNLAIRATGSDYPSTCTYSMVGEDIFDCILIEFNHIATEEVEFQNLALKLRKRFPNALIVFINSWSPFQYIHLDRKQSACGVKDQYFGRHLRRMDTSGEDWMKVVENSTSAAWQFLETKQSSKIIQATAQMVGGLVWEFPRFPEDHVESIRQFGPMFLHDCHHYGILGHEFIRDSIQHLVNSWNRSDVVGSWERLDQCEMYFESGETSNATLTDMNMTKFRKDKYALEVAHTGSFLHILNKLPRPVEVHLNYMVTAPVKIYPTVNISMNGQNTVIDPILIDAYDHPVHIVRMQSLGRVGPGEVAAINIVPLETQQQPFRVVGVSMLENTEEQPKQDIAQIPSSPPVSVVVSQSEDHESDNTTNAPENAVTEQINLDTNNVSLAIENSSITNQYQDEVVQLSVEDPNEKINDVNPSGGKESVFANMDNEEAVVVVDTNSVHRDVSVDEHRLLEEHQESIPGNSNDGAGTTTGEEKITVSSDPPETSEQRSARKVAQARALSVSYQTTNGGQIQEPYSSENGIHRRLALVDPKTVEEKKRQMTATASDGELSVASLPLCPKKEKKKKSLTAMLDDQAGKKTAAPVPCALSLAPSRSPVTPSPTWAPIRPTPVKKKKKMGLSGVLG